MDVGQLEWRKAKNDADWKLLMNNICATLVKTDRKKYNEKYIGKYFSAYLTWKF